MEDGTFTIDGPSTLTLGDLDITFKKLKMCPTGMPEPSVFATLTDLFKIPEPYLREPPASGYAAMALRPSPFPFRIMAVAAAAADWTEEFIRPDRTLDSPGAAEDIASVIAAMAGAKARRDGLREVPK